MHDGEGGELVVRRGREHVHGAMAVERIRIAEIGEGREHGAVVHMMAVHDVVRIREIGGIGRRQEDATERHPACLPVEVGF